MDNKKKSQTTDELLYELMVELDNRETSAEPKKSILIISTPRSGSTLYCETLSNSNLIGECKEWFNMRYIQAYARLKGTKNIDFEQYTHFVKTRTANKSGVFAVNMHVEQYLSLLAHKIDILKLDFDAIVYLERKNKLSQAVSLVKASITDQWSNDTSPIKDLPDKLPYSAISQALFNLISQQEYYERELASKCNFHYYYEDFNDLTQLNYYNEVLVLLGLQMPENIKLNSQLTRQFDQYSKDQIENYKNYIQGI